MNIKDKLYSNAIISAILAIIFVYLIIVTSAEIKDKNEHHMHTHELHISLSELEKITYDYLINQDKIIVLQWKTKYESINKDFNTVISHQEEDHKILMISMYSDFEKIQALFLEINQNPENIELSKDPKVIELLGLSDSLILNAFQISEEELHEGLSTQKLANLLTITLMIILAFSVIIISILIAKTISEPLEDLTKGVSRISHGKLKQKIEVETKDELGILAESFNKMAVNLQKSIDKNKEYSRTLEKKVKERTKKLVKSNKLKEMFVDILRHDILNPINVIGLYTNMIKGTKKDKASIRSIKKALNKIEDITNKSQQYARVEDAKSIVKREMDLKVVIDQVCKDVRPNYRDQNVKLINHVKNKILINANPLVYDIWLNFLTNALKYGKEGKKVEVSVKSKDKNYEIRVTDYGEGIEKKFQKEIFGRLERVEKKGVKGTGLGLAIAKKIANLHGGDVWVEDNPKGGAIFVTSLPKK